jgi:hypothetical protein
LTAARRGSVWTDRALASLGIAAGALFLLVPSILQKPRAVAGLRHRRRCRRWPARRCSRSSAAWRRCSSCTRRHAGTILIETYSLSVSPTLPAIPLFTLAGFLLAEGHASERLLRVFRAFFGWIPGGTAVVCAVLCSFFTVFTGGSGVTILALGGVLFPALDQGRLSREVRARAAHRRGRSACCCRPRCR